MQPMTLRIIFTGLIVYGPILGINQDTTDFWALMVKADDHETKLRLGCTDDGLHCLKVKDITGSDLKLLVGGQPLAVQSPFRIDYSFRNFVADVSEITGASAPGHLRCSSPKQNSVASRKGMDIEPTLLNPTATGAGLAKVSARMYLTAGYDYDHSNTYKCLQNKLYCRGVVRAARVSTCNDWVFKPGLNPKFCTRMSNTVVYELQIETRNVDLVLRSHANGTETSISGLELPAANTPGTVEIWVQNAPEKEMGDFDHFKKLYGLFRGGGINMRVPEIRNDAPGHACNELPGMRPVWCPGMQFAPIMKAKGKAQ